MFNRPSCLKHVQVEPFMTFGLLLLLPVVNVCDQGEKVKSSEVTVRSKVKCTFKTVVPIVLNIYIASESDVVVYKNRSSVMLQSFQTCALISFQIKKPLIFV